jgi:hypothetical protein
MQDFSNALAEQRRKDYEAEKEFLRRHGPVYTAPKEDQNK